MTQTAYNLPYPKKQKAEKLTVPFESETNASSPDVDCIIPSSHCPLGCLHQTRSFWGNNQKQKANLTEKHTIYH